jgi:hypothetical protein
MHTSTICPIISFNSLQEFLAIFQYWNYIAPFRNPSFLRESYFAGQDIVWNTELGKKIMHELQKIHIGTLIFGW